jgi:hypothetical protein
MKTGWLVAVSLASGVLLTPQLAFACPYCAGRGGITPAMMALIGGILLLPYAIGWTVMWAVRRTAADLDDSSTASHASPKIR